MSGRRTLTPPTAAQLQVLDFIRDFTAKHRYAPTLREIRDRFGWATIASAQHHLEPLKFKGLVTWEKGKARTLRVL